jgi:hypothetical protein
MNITVNYLDTKGTVHNRKDYAENGITNEISSFRFEDVEGNQNIYINNDRVGYE